MDSFTQGMDLISGTREWDLTEEGRKIKYTLWVARTQRKLRLTVEVDEGSIFFNDLRDIIDQLETEGEVSIDPSKAN